MFLALHRAAHFAALAWFLFTISFVNIHCGTVEAKLDPPTAAPAVQPSATPADIPTGELISVVLPTLTETATHTATAEPLARPSATLGVAPPTDTATPTFTLTPTLPPTLTATAEPKVRLGATPAVTVTLPLTPTVAPIAPRTERIPILMYHHISAPPPGSDFLRIDLSVPPDVFEAQLKYLADQGYHTIHLTDLVNHWQSGTELAPKPIILTFDDGYDDNYTNAFPTLKDFGFTGTFFVITGRADSNAAGYLTWAQIEEMAATGMEIGGHSLDHRYDLGRMPKSVQWAEIKPAFDAIAQHLPSQVPVFAYPSGSYNATTVSLLQQLGYIASVTTQQSSWQYADRPLELRRIRIRGQWTVDNFVFWLDYWTKGQ